MNKIQKALKKLTDSERTEIKNIIKALLSERFDGLNIKKLKGFDDIFRVRKNKIRIIYRVQNKTIFIIKIDRRKENTYKL